MVQVLVFSTGRMALKLKTGAKAFSSAGWFGSEQFTTMTLDTAGRADVKS